MAENPARNRLSRHVGERWFLDLLRLASNIACLASLEVSSCLAVTGLHTAIETIGVSVFEDAISYRTGTGGGCGK